MEDLISVIVPVYNVEKYLSECIESIIKQTYKNIDIVLVNDGSKDNSAKICEEYKKKDDRITVINKSNGGLSSARNAGIDIAKGKYICFVDSDDFIDKNMLFLLHESIKNNAVRLSICNRIHYYDYKKSKNMYKYYFKTNLKGDIKLSNKEAIKELCSFKLFDMSACGKLFDISLFKDIRFPNNKLSEDYFVMYKLFCLCDNVSYIYDALYYYRQRKGSISKNKKINYDYRDASFEQMEFIEKKYPELKRYVRTSYALANITIFHQYINNRNEYPNKCEIKELQKNVRDNYNYIKENEKLSFKRKFQIFLFIRNIYLYTLIYKLYKN